MMKVFKSSQASTESVMLKRKAIRGVLDIEYCMR